MPEKIDDKNYTDGASHAPQQNPGNAPYSGPGNVPYGDAGNAQYSDPGNVPYSDGAQKSLSDTPLPPDKPSAPSAVSQLPHTAGKDTVTPSSKNGVADGSSTTETPTKRAAEKNSVSPVVKTSPEREIKSPRKLRARQCAQLQENFYNEEKDTEEPEKEKPIATPELRPRRSTRKPRHTQRVWRLDIMGDAFDKWRQIGQSKQLTSDTEIAVFLMEHYENVLSGRPTGAYCIQCNSLLTFSCLVCHTPTQIPDTTMVVAEDGGVIAKVEPQEVVSDEERAAEPFEMAPDDDGVEEEKGDKDGDRDWKAKKPAPKGKRKRVSACKGGQVVRTSNNFPEMAPEDDGGEEEKDDKDSDWKAKKPAPKGKRKRGRPPASSSGGGGSGAGGGGGGGAAKKKSYSLKHKPRKYKCTYEGCVAAFAKSSRLKVHIRIHTGEKPYVCKTCDKAFTQSSGLKVHMNVHTGLRPYACKECNKAFPSTSTLKQHMRRHTGEKPFTCPRCDKTFRWSGHLTQHLRIHDGVKPFLCQDCGKSFTASSDLVKHKVTHTQDRPYKCSLCPKAYSFKHRLTAHQRSHTGERPFLCSLCGSAFARAHNLAVHYRTHTGDKPYWCKECGARFSDSGNFSKHKKIKHGDMGKRARERERLAALNKPTPPVSENSSSIPAPKPEPDYNRLPDFSRVGELSKMTEYAQLEPGSGGRLPSMSRMMGLDEGGYLPVGSVEHSKVAPSRADSAAPSPHPPRSSPPTDIADFKSLLPPMGGDSHVTAIPPHMSSHLPVGSPPPIPVHSRHSASPAISLPPHPSPGPATPNDSRISPMPQPAHQIQDYRMPQHDGVVFPPHYYSTYPYYYPQQ